MRALSKTIQLAHDQACRRGQGSYVDPETGLSVMTALKLQAAGHCCGSGCRHCPWPPEVQRAAGRPVIG